MPSLRGRFGRGAPGREIGANLKRHAVIVARLRTARARVHGTRSYLLWHNPMKVIERSKRHFVNGPHELVVGSNSARIEAMAALRHRVAHGQADAKANFDAATMMFVGRRYGGSRAGRFLRDWAPGATPSKRWLPVLSEELVALARAADDGSFACRQLNRPAQTDLLTRR
jgi:hypothetical protein